MTTATRTGPLLLLLLALAPSRPRAEEPAAVRREIVRKGEGEAVAAVPIDARIYAGTRDDFSDLRVYDDRDAEVPFVVEPVLRLAPVTVREDVPTRIEHKGSDQERATVIVVKLEDGGPEPDGVTVRTPLRDFEYKVAVAGSEDGYEWVPLSDAQIYDYSSYMDVRQLDVPFGPRPRGLRSFRLTFARHRPTLPTPLGLISRDLSNPRKPPPMELRLPPRYPIRIDRLDFWRTVERGVAEKPVTTPVALPPPEIDPAYRPGVRGARPPGGPRETRVDVDTQGLPLTRISLRTTNQTFHRPVRVLADVDGSWAEVARETIYRHEMGEFHRESLGVPLPGRRFGRLRIIVDDGDYPQLEITEVEGEHAEHRIVFPAEPGRRYHLAYGSNDMKAPRYDLAATLAAPGRPREEVSLDEPGGIPDPRHAEPSPVPFASAAWVQSALALTTAALLGGLIRAHRRAAGARTGGFDRRRARG